MSQLRALYFPETAITTEQVLQELLFFDSLYFYHSSEPDEHADSQPGEGECHGYPPVPFDDDLQRFKQLIRELKGNEEEFYSGHLSSISLDYMENRDETTVRNLISTIAGPDKTAETREQPNKREDLWQARLLLKLAEILAKEEKELQESLTAISGKEEELFDALKGEEGFSSSLGPIPSASTLPVRPEILLKAWGKLFLADQKDHWILTSSQPESVESLFEINEALSRQRPVRLFRIPLPYTDGMDETTFFKLRKSFRHTAKQTLDSFTSLLTETAENGISPETLKEFTSLAADWTRIFDQSGPWGQDTSSPLQKKDGLGAPHLEVYLCSHSLAELLGNFCKIKNHKQNTHTHGIIALKSRKSSTCKG